MSRRPEASAPKSHDKRTTPPKRSRPFASLVFGAALALSITGCPSVASTPTARPPTADKWFQRAKQAYSVADIEDARDSVKKALSSVPDDKEVRMLAARIALAQLDYAESLRLLKGLKGSEAAGMRGRALWYNGDLERAADELEAMLNDPDVVDDWAKNIVKLARRGAGRTPFSLSGAPLVQVDLGAVSPMEPYYVVPVEIDGENALAVISTSNAEVVLDSSTRHEPSWVSLAFGKRLEMKNLPSLIHDGVVPAMVESDRKLEVHDVPALAQDLSGYKKRLNGAPIKALIGVNLLRHLHATLDFAGGQFVARTFSPPPPPDATRVDLSYIRGGGMILRGKFGGERGEPVSLLLDTSLPFPLALDEGGWKKAGSNAKDLKMYDPEQKIRQGVVPLVRIGAFDVPQVFGIYGAGVDQIEKQISLDIDGLVGSGMLAPFRVTFADQGRLMWMEDTGGLVQQMMSEPAPRQPIPEELTPPMGPSPSKDPGGSLNPEPSLKLPQPPGTGNPAAPSPGGNAPPGGAKPKRN